MLSTTKISTFRIQRSRTLFEAYAEILKLCRQYLDEVEILDDVDNDDDVDTDDDVETELEVDALEVNIFTVSMKST